jgi:hypothetical protein
MNATLGRFQSMDSYEGDQEDPLSLSKYQYVANDPTDKTDPSGNQYDVGSLGFTAAIATLAFSIPEVTAPTADFKGPDSLVKIMEDQNPSTHGLTVHTMLVFYQWNNPKLVEEVLEAGPQRHVGEALFWKPVGTKPEQYGYLKKNPLPHTQIARPNVSVYETLKNPHGNTQQADTEFKQDILKVFNSYQDDVLYFYEPSLYPHTGNSNSFAGSLARGIGQDDGGPLNAPGWNTEVISSKP